MSNEQQTSDNQQGHTPIAGVTCRFSDSDMISFGNFIRDNYYGVGAPRLLSYDPAKYPHGKIEEIFVVWCCENGY